jgi:hypothetical protein
MVSSDGNQLSVTASQTEGVMFGLTVDDPVFGAQNIETEWISNSTTSCYYTAADTPELVIKTTETGKLTVGPVSGTFSSKLSLTNGTCDAQTISITGTFVAAVCTQ